MFTEISDSNLKEIVDYTKNYIQLSYEEPHRHYHTIVHINKMLLLLNLHKENLNLSNIDYYKLFMAVCFHDIVYNTHIKDSDNIQKSCESFISYQYNYIDPLFEINYMDDVILLIKSTDYSINRDTDNQQLEHLIEILNDLDLWILSSPRNKYLQYSKDIRKEYAHVEDSDFVNGRLEILYKLFRLANSGKLYKLFPEWNEFAAKNIGTEIESLKNFSSVNFSNQAVDEFKKSKDVAVSLVDDCLIWAENTTNKIGNLQKVMLAKRSIEIITIPIHTCSTCKNLVSFDHNQVGEPLFEVVTTCRLGYTGGNFDTWGCTEHTSLHSNNKK